MTLLRNSSLFGLANTDTFRRSSKRLFSRWGSNLQNPSEGILPIYRPSHDDYSFVQPDQSGAEALVVSWLAPKGKFRELFLNGIKSHTYVAANIFTDKWISDGHGIARDLLSIPIDILSGLPDWKALSEHIKNNCKLEYFIGKKSCHSFNYRMSPATFREDVLKESGGEVALSKLEAQKFHAIYHSIFPEISNHWWPEIENLVRRTGYLYNLFGFPCYCQGPYTDKTWRELTAWVPQSTVGCLTAIAVCDVQDFIEENNLEDRWHILNDKHDSFLVECPDEDIEVCARVSQAAMKQELESPRGEKFRMGSAVCVGKNWGDGMEEVSF